jgi:hypothetical protein
MRSFSAGFQNKLAAGTFNPVVFMDYTLKEYVSADDPGDGSLITTVYRWAEREITYGGNTYQPRLVNLSTLSFDLDASQQVFGEMAMQVGNNIDQLISVIQPGMTATVYLGFEESDSSVTDAEVMFIGTVEGDIEITEDSVSFNLQDIAYSYDRQMPNLVDDANFPGAGREDVGLPMPIIVGRAKDHACRSVTGQFTTYIAEEVTPTYTTETIWASGSAQGNFQQTTEQLISNTAGGYWYASAGITDGLETSIDGSGITVTKFARSEVESTVYLNALTSTIPWEENDYIGFQITVADWNSGYFTLTGPFDDSSDDEPALSTTRKFYSNEGSASVSVVSKIVSKITTGANAGNHNILGVYFSDDFEGTFAITSILKYNISSANNFVYVSDDVAHWYRTKAESVSTYNEQTGQTDTSTELNFEVQISHVVDRSDSSVVEGYLKSSNGKVVSYHTVKDIQHDTANVSYSSLDSGAIDSPIHPVLIKNNVIKVYGNGASIVDVEAGQYVGINETNEIVPAVINTNPYSRSEGSVNIYETLGDLNIAQVESVDEFQKTITLSDDVEDNYTENFGPVSFYGTVDSISGTITVDAGWFEDFDTMGLSGADAPWILIEAAGGAENEVPLKVESITSDTIQLAEPMSGFGWLELYDYTGTIMLSAISEPQTLGESGYEAYDENALNNIESANFDVYPRNLWKLIFEKPIPFYGFKRGDALSQSNRSVYSEDEVFLVADHPVQRINNIKINGIPLENYDDFIIKTNSTDYAKDGKARSYLTIPADKLENVARLALQVNEDDKFIVDNSGVYDTIIIEDPGHTHYIGAERTFNWALNISFRFVGANVIGRVRSGSYDQIIYDSKNNLFLTNPIRFTSNSPEVEIIFTPSDLSISPFVSFVIFYRDYFKVEFEREDNFSGEKFFDFQTLTRQSYGYIPSMTTVKSKMPIPAGESNTGLSPAQIDKLGGALKSGDNADVGYLNLDLPFGIAQVRSNLQVTCDVIGNPDGTSGYKMPHEQIKTIINKYAQNPVNGTEGNADIVEFVNEAEMIAAFSKVWNTFSSLESAEDIWPKMRELVEVSSESATNLSPDSELGNSVLPILREGTVKEYNEKSIHCLDFAINSTNQLRDLIGEMLLHSNMICIWRNGIAYLKYLPDAPTADDSLTTADVVMKSMSLSRSPVSQLATDITINYDYGKDGFSRDYHYAKQVWSDGELSITKLDATRKFGSYSREKFFDMPMIRERAAAELLAKRFYEELGDSKFHSRFETTLTNLALEPGDNVTVPIPIHRDSVMDRGLITRKVITWGSAVDKKPDLIAYDVRENHTTSGYYLSLNL